MRVARQMAGKGLVAGVLVALIVSRPESLGECDGPIDPPR